MKQTTIIFEEPKVPPRREMGYDSEHHEQPEYVRVLVRGWDLK